MAARLVERPEVVQINQDMWRINWLSDDEWGAAHLDDNSGGLTYGRETTIYIRTAPNCMEQHYQATLLHELMHAALSTNYGTGQSAMDEMKADEAEEFMVGLLAPPLLFVLKYNEHVRKYLLSDGTVQR
jgi:hypothetical protein